MVLLKRRLIIENLYNETLLGEAAVRTYTSPLNSSSFLFALVEDLEVNTETHVSVDMRVVDAQCIPL